MTALTYTGRCTLTRDDVTVEATVTLAGDEDSWRGTATSDNMAGLILLERGSGPAQLVLEDDRAGTVEVTASTITPAALAEAELTGEGPWPA